MYRKLKRITYVILVSLLATGIAYAVPVYLDLWLFYELVLPISGHTLMAIHGAFAFASIYLLGYLYRMHVMPHLRGRRHRSTGLPQLLLLLLLIVSGYGLYYVGDAAWRDFTSHTHLLAGMVLPICLVLHRRQAKDNK